MVEKYGKKLYKNHMLGYKDSQLLLGLEHNTPNNTLPIFWSEKGWNPKKNVSLGEFFHSPFHQQLFSV
jgi:hypothetical protein